MLAAGEGSAALLAAVDARERVQVPALTALERGDEASFDAVVACGHGLLAQASPWMSQAASLLRDQGRFGVHFERPPDFRWDNLSRRLADVGLWPHARFLLRQLPLTGRVVRIRPSQLMALGTYAVLTGERIPRSAFRMREAIRISLQETGRARVTVVSGSMHPTFAIGAEVEVEPCPRAQRNDIVLFERGTKLVLHRVLARVAGYLVQRGDAERERAGLIRDWRVIARVVG